MPKNSKAKKEAMFLVESQPPHIGELLSVLMKIDEYDFIYVVVTGTPLVLPVAHALTTWSVMLKAYKDKVLICSSNQKFTEIVKLPKQYKDCTVLTTSRKTFIHMSSNNIASELVGRPMGYHSTFLRTAYRQGRALDWLINKATPQMKHDKYVLPKEMVKDAKVKN